jgi:hypothetical protein
MTVLQGNHSLPIAKLDGSIFSLHNYISLYNSRPCKLQLHFFSNYLPSSTIAVRIIATTEIRFNKSYSSVCLSHSYLANHDFVVYDRFDVMHKDSPSMRCREKESVSHGLKV